MFRTTFLISLAVGSMFSVNAAMFDRQIVKRQSIGAFDPSVIPDSCKDGCDSLTPSVTTCLQTVQGLGQVCYCTPTFEQTLKTCVQCVLSVPQDGIVQSQGQTIITSYNGLCNTTDVVSYAPSSSKPVSSKTTSSVVPTSSSSTSSSSSLVTISAPASSAVLIPGSGGTTSAPTTLVTAIPTSAAPGRISKDLSMLLGALPALFVVMWFA